MLNKLLKSKWFWWIGAALLFLWMSKDVIIDILVNGADKAMEKAKVKEKEIKDRIDKAKNEDGRLDEKLDEIDKSKDENWHE